MPGQRAGSPIADYAQVQCPKTKTGQEKVQFYCEDKLLFLSSYYLSMPQKHKPSNCWAEKNIRGGDVRPIQNWGLTAHSLIRFAPTEGHSCGHPISKNCLTSRLATIEKSQMIVTKLNNPKQDGIAVFRNVKSFVQKKSYYFQTVFSSASVKYPINPSVPHHAHPHPSPIYCRDPPPPPTIHGSI